MRIFFLAPKYMGLYKPIMDELQRQGHDVFWMEDILLPKDPNLKAGNIVRRKLKRLYRKMFRTEEKYWHQKIKHEAAYNHNYDIILCIDGVSFHPCLLKHLKKKNPSIKAILYLWDTNKYYDFLRYRNHFDRILTFDLDDAEHEDGVELLHSYWMPSQPREQKYNILMVGSDHDDRLSIMSEIYAQLKKTALPFYIRVVVTNPQKLTLPFTSTEQVAIEEYLQLIDESGCILDTDKQLQTGAAQRVIWALAKGKKVITTNSSLKRMPFYNSKQIKFVDRQNPVLDINFIVRKETFPICEEIQELRIDKWIHRLIDFEI